MNKKGGSKLKRTTLVQLRTTEKLNFAFCLAAKSQIRTLATFIEGAVKSYIETMDAKNHIADYYLFGADTNNTAFNVLIDKVWDPEPSIRFVRLGLTAPTLLSVDEEQLFEKIKGQQLLWLSEARTEDSLNKRLLMEVWPVIEKAGEDILHNDELIIRQLSALYKPSQQQRDMLFDLLRQITEG